MFAHENPEDLIGQKVWKNRSSKTKTTPKPFKSGLKVNTVKAVTINPHSQRPGFTFFEDESIVNCERVSAAPPEFIESQK